MPGPGLPIGQCSGVLRATEALARAYGLRILGCLSKPASKNALREILEHISVEYRPKARSLDVDITEADLGRGGVKLNTQGRVAVAKCLGGGRKAVLTA